MYIRTKDGIFEVEKLNLNKIVGNIKYEIINNKLLKTMYGYEAHLFEYDIISQADTIEELCDEFVVKYKDHTTPYVLYDQVFPSLKDYCEYNKEFEFDLYGAIWTDKGLIYVAKMNENGVLELI